MTPSISVETLDLELELLRVRVIDYRCNERGCECSERPYHLWAAPHTDDAWMFLGWAEPDTDCAALARECIAAASEEFVVKAALTYTLEWESVLADPVAMGLKINQLMIAMPQEVRDEMDSMTIEEVRQVGAEVREEAEEQARAVEQLVEEMGVEVVAMRPFKGGMILTVTQDPLTSDDLPETG